MRNMNIVCIEKPICHSSYKKPAQRKKNIVINLIIMYMTVICIYKHVNIIIINVNVIYIEREQFEHNILQQYLLSLIDSMTHMS